MKRTIICFALILAILCPVLFSCGSNNMKFSNEQEMIDYLNGTFENENMMYIIQAGEITEIDKEEAFSTSEQNLKKVAFSLPENTSVDKLRLDQFLEYCYGVNQYDVAYNNKKGTVSFGGKTLSVDLDGNLCDKEGNICKWISEDTSPSTDLMKDRFNKYMPALIEYYSENIGINIVGTWRYEFASDVTTNERFTPDDKEHTGNGLYNVKYVKTMTFWKDGKGRFDWSYGNTTDIAWEKATGTDELTGYKVTYRDSTTRELKTCYVYCMFSDGEFYLASSDTRTYSVHNRDSEYLYYAKD